MTCVDMCKPFTSVFPAYPRTSYTGHLTPSQGLTKMQEPLDLGPTQSTPLSLSSLPYPTSSSLSSSLLSPSSSRNSVIVPASTPTVPSSSLVKEESKKDIEPKVAHYLGVNCVLFTYFSGDTSAVVDDHFTRALNQSSGYDTASNLTRDKIQVNKGHPRPMTARNLPPSFWNSSYQYHVGQQHFLGQSGQQYPSSGASGSAASDLNSFHSTHPYFSPALHSLSNLPTDPWTYSFSSPSTSMSYPHRPVPYDLSYSTSSRFGQSYSSFLMQPSTVRSAPFSTMGGHSDVTKASEHSRPRFSDPRFGPDYVTHHGSCTVLDAGTGLQEATKDLYWF